MERVVIRPHLMAQLLILSIRGQVGERTLASRGHESDLLMPTKVSCMPSASYSCIRALVEGRKLG